MRKYLFPLLLTLAILSQACTPSTPDTSPTAVPGDPTQSPVLTEVPAQPSSEVTATETAPAVVVAVSHVDVPAGGTSDRLTAHDQDNAFFFENKTARSGDEFYKNEFERPFTANDMAYLPDLDIVNFSITNDDKFFYVQVSVAALDAATQSLTGSYGVEIDRNADGRAEILIVTRPPYGAGFTAENVAVYLDKNGDVGGDRLNRPDTFASDGFETVVFDLSANKYPEGDTDFAWVRQTQDGSLPAIEVAFKSWMFETNQAFMWSVDASEATISPSMMYYQDHFTAEEAGSARKDDPNYPVKSLWGVDNTCRFSQGFDTTGNEPFGCFVVGASSEIVSAPSADLTCAQYAELCNRLPK